MRNMDNGVSVELDVTEEALHDYGINLNGQQLTDLALINLLKATGELGEKDYVTIILFVLKFLGLLPDQINTSFPFDKLRYAKFETETGNQSQ